MKPTYCHRVFLLQQNNFNRFIFENLITDLSVAENKLQHIPIGRFKGDSAFHAWFPKPNFLHIQCIIEVIVEIIVKKKTHIETKVTIPDGQVPH